MNLLWITGRRLGKDLASHTELRLAKSLCKMGINVTIVSPGDKVIDGHNEINFLMLKEIQIKGLKTISGGMSIKKTISKSKLKFQYAIVDWRMVHFSSGYLKKEIIPWSLIDRGPPTFDGILAKIQRLQWRNSWKIADRNTNNAFVVSKLHSEYVREKTKFAKQISILPAGVDRKWIDKEGKMYKNEIIFCYSGSLDKNRGVKKIIQFSKNLKDLSVKSKIIIMGKGNCSKYFENKSKEIENIEYMGNKIKRREVEDILSSCHVGIMPMPDEEVWNISSSIKLPEYLSKGMLIIGVKHPGNFDGSGAFYQLSDSNWPRKSIDKLSVIIDNNQWEEYSKKSIEKAEMMTWEKTAQKIVEIIRKK